MDQRESTDGCLNCEGVPTDGCSQIYVGDIDIIFENVVARKIYHENKYEYLVVTNEEPRSTSPSPLELQEVDQIKKKEEEEVVGDIYHLTHSFWSICPSYTTILSIIGLINISGALNVII